MQACAEVVSPGAGYVDGPPTTTVPEMSYSIFPILHAPCPGEEALRLTMVVSPLGFQVRVLVSVGIIARLCVGDLGVQPEMVMVPVKVPMSLAHRMVGGHALVHAIDAVYVNRS